ncbi:hypothetical protein L209DRAFT_758943 [Thermothelomyces heterothallicus CBS 203.75]
MRAVVRNRSLCLAGLQALCQLDKAHLVPLESPPHLPAIDLPGRQRFSTRHTCSFNSPGGWEEWQNQRRLDWLSCCRAAGWVRCGVASSLASLRTKANPLV